MSCIRAAYSRSSSSASVMPSSRPTAERQLGHPARVPGLGVAADLGDPGQRPDRLRVRLPDAGVPAERELGEQQRHDEDRQRPAAHDLRGQRDRARRWRRWPSRGRPGPASRCAARTGTARGRGRPAPAPRRTASNSPATHRDGDHHQQRARPCRVGCCASCPQSPARRRTAGRNSSGRERDRQQPAGQRVEPERAAGHDVRDGADEAGQRGHRDDVGDRVRGRLVPPNWPSSAYASAPAAAIGAASPSPGSVMRTSSPSAMKTPKATAMPRWSQVVVHRRDDRRRRARAARHPTTSDGAAARRRSGGAAVRHGALLGEWRDGERRVVVVDEPACAASQRPPRRRRAGDLGALPGLARPAPATSASTMRGSNCVPSQRCSSATASSTSRAPR